MQSAKLICVYYRPTCHLLVKWQLAPVAVLASILYPGSESLECRQIDQGMAVVRIFDRRDVNEAQAIVEFERSATDSAQLFAFEFFKHFANQALILDGTAIAVSNTTAR